METIERFGVTDDHFNVTESRKLIKENIGQWCLYPYFDSYRITVQEGTLEIPGSISQASMKCGQYKPGLWIQMKWSLNPGSATF